MRGTNNFAKKYFLAQFSTKFSLFLSAPVEFLKIQFSKNCLFSFDEGPKSLAQFDIVLNFHYFCKVRACRISVKNSIFQKLPKIVEKHFSR